MLSVNELEFLTQVYQMKKVYASIALLCTVCLNVQCQKAEIHKNDGTTVEIPVEDIDSITFSMTNPFNFETRTVKLNSGYDMPIIGIGTYLLSTAQAEEYVYNALKVGISLMGIGGDEEVGVYLIHLGLPMATFIAISSSMLPSSTTTTCSLA